MNTLPLTGKIASVTGSSSGIGSAIAIELARAGADVAVSYHSSRDGAEAVVEEIEKTGRRAFCERLNVGEPESVNSYFDAVAAGLGPIDILVNNAGIDGRTAEISQMDAADWDQVISVNLRGPFLCIRKVLPGMLSRHHGAILNITSVHEVIPWGGHAAYCSSKAGVAMMTRSLSLELQDSGVRVVSLAPGAIRTPINKDVWDDPEKMADLKTKIPMGRIGEAEEIARMARVLASDEASYLTGVTVTIDGGMTTYPSFAHGG
jgi:NAD(P)-dependent dehydrogenase (short-subunit alcohol dehydrogenase family)